MKYCVMKKKTKDPVKQGAINRPSRSKSISESKESLHTRSQRPKKIVEGSLQQTKKLRLPVGRDSSVMKNTSNNLEKGRTLQASFQQCNEVKNSIDHGKLSNQSSLHDF